MKTYPLELVETYHGAFVYQDKSGHRWTLGFPLHSLANESEALVSDTEFVGMGNEIAIGDDGMALIPYGSWPHVDGMQRFGKAEAEQMVGYFKNVWNQMKRAVTGLPIFKGHPDLPGMANEYPDKTEYGQISDMQARDDGLALKLVLGSSGAALVKRGLKYISPHWLANQVGRQPNGKPIFAPVFMKSVGLTDHPNIPGKSLLNTASAGSQQQHQSTTTMPDWLKKLLGLANEATEDQVKSKVSDLLARPEPSALANEQSAKTNAEARVTALTTDNAKLSTSLTEAQTALANERKARVDETVASAIRTGKIAEAEKATWAKRLLTNFEEESKALANSKSGPKTAAVANPQHAELGNATADAGAKIKGLVNAEMAKLGHVPMANRYNMAFANVKKANPKLFQADDGDGDEC